MNSRDCKAAGGGGKRGWSLPWHHVSSRVLTATQSASASTGTLVGGIVGGILAFLIVILIVVGCCVCFRMRNSTKGRHDVSLDQPARSSSIQSNGNNSGNHYMTWGTFSKGSSTRGVKFVDYIDYYMWLNNLSAEQQRAQAQAHAYPAPSYTSRKSKSAQNGSSPKSRNKTSSNSASSLQDEAQRSVHHVTSIPNANNNIAETNIDSNTDRSEAE